MFSYYGMYFLDDFYILTVLLFIITVELLLLLVRYLLKVAMFGSISNIFL